MQLFIEKYVDIDFLKKRIILDWVFVSMCMRYIGIGKKDENFIFWVMEFWTVVSVMKFQSNPETDFLSQNQFEKLGTKNLKKKKG